MHTNILYIYVYMCPGGGLGVQFPPAPAKSRPGIFPFQETKRCQRTNLHVAARYGGMPSKTCRDEGVYCSVGQATARRASVDGTNKGKVIPTYIAK